MEFDNGQLTMDNGHFSNVKRCQLIFLSPFAALHCQLSIVNCPLLRGDNKVSLSDGAEPFEAHQPSTFL